MKLWFQKHTVEGRMPLLDRWYREHLKAIAAPDTRIDIHTLPASAYPADLPEKVVRFGAVETFFGNYFAGQALTAEQSGYDAYIIATSQDPGLAQARSLAGIPVLGYGETTFHLAAMTGQRFAVVGFIPELAEPILDNIRLSGLERRFVGFEYLRDGQSLVHDALRGDVDAFLTAFSAAARRAVERGAQVIMPGEGLPNEILVHEKVHEIDGVPVVDSDGAVVKMAELLVGLRRLGIFGRSTNGYWFDRPDMGYLRHLQDVFGPGER